MKNIEKFVIPGLVILILAILYFSYFAPSDELGSFSRLDSNSNASVPIIVKLVKDRGIQRAKDGSYIFHVVDKENKVVQVNGLKNLPPGFDDSKSMVISGHLSDKNSFHAHSVELRN